MDVEAQELPPPVVRAPFVAVVQPGTAPRRQRYAAAVANAARADARPGTPPAAANAGWAMFR
jgi:hypothetical protein